MTSPNGDPPTLTSLLMELQEAGIKQGKAIARDDKATAGAQHRKGLLIIDQIRVMVGEEGVQPRPILNTHPGGGINT